MAGRIPQNFIDDLISRTDIVEVVNSRVPLKRKGKEYTACCPFHNEKTPSFTVSENKQFYHCFGCGAHGSTIGFLMEFDHLNYIEAIETLAADQHLDIPREDNHVGQQQKNTRPLYGAMQQAGELFQQQLTQSTAAIDYLKHRGISGELAKKYRIGYAPDKWDFIYQRLTASAFTSAQLLEAGLLTKNERQKTYDRFRDRIIFPIADQRGRTIGFGGRVLDKGEPKYLNSPETPVFHKGRELYGLYEARQCLRKIDRLLVVEGYMDVVALSQHGIEYAVASLGTATTTEQILKLFRTTDDIIFCYDGDSAGKKAAWRALENTLPVIRDGMVARFLFLPEMEDPDTMIRQEGKSAFEQRIAQAMPLSDFFFTHLKINIDTETREGRAQLAQQAKPLLNKMHNSIYRDLLVKELSQLVGLTSEHLETRIAPAQSLTSVTPAPINRKQRVKNTKTRVAIALLLQNPELASLHPIPESFQTAIIRGLPLLYHLYQTIQSNPAITPAALLERYRDHEYEQALASLAIWSSPETENTETREQDFITIIKRLEQEERYEYLTRKEETGGLTEAEIREFLVLSVK